MFKAHQSGQLVLSFQVFQALFCRIFVIVGCAYGCGKDTSTPGRGNPTEYLRRQAHMMFHRLHTINEPEAKKFLRGIFTKQELQHVVDFCHAFFGSCVSPTVQDQTRSSRQTKKSLGWGKRPLYQILTVEFIFFLFTVAALAAKPVITQLMANVDRLKRPENMVRNIQPSKLIFIRGSFRIKQQTFVELGGNSDLSYVMSSFHEKLLPSTEPEWGKNLLLVHAACSAINRCNFQSIYSETKLRMCRKLISKASLALEASTN